MTLTRITPISHAITFFNTFFYHLDEIAPYRKVTKNEYKLMLKPWISKEILNKHSDIR